MPCESCGGNPKGPFNPRVSISSIQDAFKEYHGRGTLHINRSQVQQVLSEGEKDLKDYDTEIARLQARVLFFERKKDRLQAHLSDCTSLISSIRRLPDDILRIIFDYHACRPLILGAVCSHWRAIVLSTPSLWSQITFLFDSDTGRPLAMTTNALQLYLDRSKESALHMEIFVSHFGAGQPLSIDYFEHQAFQYLATHAHRWKTLGLTIQSSLGFLERHSVLSCPQLEHLTLYGSNLEGPSPPINLTLMPKLHSVTIDTSYTHYVHPSVPWHQITKLSLNSLSSVPQFLVACPNLLVLQIELKPNESNPIPDDVQTLTTHHGLSKLTLSFFQTAPDEDEDDDDNELVSNLDVLVSILAQLDLPNLNSFQLVVSTRINRYPLTDWSVEALATFTSFMDRCGGHLAVLNLMDLSMDLSNLLSILRKVPSLVELTLSDSPLSKTSVGGRSRLYLPPLVSSAFLRSLHAFRRFDGLSPASPLLPKLQKLRLQVDKEFDEEVFVDTISSRWIPSDDYAQEVGITSLQKVELRFGDEFFHTFDLDTVKSMTKLSSLKVLWKQGMKVDVICGGIYVDL
ncbi:hypothetical protein GG344DRAFT_76785 [Lentinula edodes]|nr:hypothetical protein GG344DRAFT_76785 [Lentinula edodes]